MLLDIGLPRLNGYDACRKIRQEPWGKRMMLVDRQKSNDAGMNGHLVKPVDLAALMQLLAESASPPV